MAINKVVFGEDTLIDLTPTTAETNDVLEGKYFMDRSGTLRQGSLVNGTSDYEELDNLPTINNIELKGNKTTGDLGIVIPTKVSDLSNDTGFITSSSLPTKVSDLSNDTGFITSASLPTKVSDLSNDSGFISSETDPIFTASDAYGITSSDITNWNGKSDFSGSYNDLTDKPTLFSGDYTDLTNKPTIPDELSDLSDDTTHRLVTDTEKTTWSGKQDALVSGTNIKTINNNSLLGSGNITISGGGGSTDVQINGTSIVVSDVANILTETAYDSSTNKIATMSDVPDTTGFIDKDVNNLTNYSLTTTLQANKSITKGIEYIVGTQASATSSWKGTSTDTGCSSGALYTGKVIIYHLNQAGSSSAATLNLTLPDGTTTGAKNVYRLASTTTTTNFAAGCDILMVYDGTNWKVNAYVDTSGSNTIGYQLRTNSALWKNKTGYKMNRYTLLFEVDGGLSGAATTIATGTSKTTINFKYIPGGVIKYYSTSGDIANDATFTANGLWDQYTCNLGYTFNTGSTLTGGKPVYMRCTVNADGTLSPDYSGTPSHPIVQDLPTTADSKVYVYLGQAYNTTNIELYMNHPIYEYKNGKLREYVDVPAPTLSTTTWVDNLF